MKKIVFLIITMTLIQQLSSSEFCWKRTKYEKVIHVLVNYMPEDFIGPWYDTDKLIVTEIFLGKSILALDYLYGT